MGISITSKTRVSAPETAPVYGHIAVEEGLRFALRATNPLNFFDLEGSSNPLATPGGLPGFSKQGIYDETRVRTVATDFSTEEAESFTCLAVCRIVNPPATEGLWRSWIYGNYGSSTAPSGRGNGLHIRTDTSSEEGTRHGLRFSFVNGGGNLFWDIFFDDLQGTNYAPSSPWVFVAQRLRRNSDGSYSAIAECLSTGERVQGTSSDVDNPYSRVNRLAGLGAESSDDPRAKIQLLGTYQNHSSSNNGPGTQYLKEALFYNRALTDLEVAQQYEATKRWLRAEGVIDISTWV